MVVNILPDQFTHCEKCKEPLTEEDFRYKEEKYVRGGVIEVGYNCHCGFERRY